jgi:hypothetical protein
MEYNPTPFNAGSQRLQIKKLLAELLIQKEIQRQKAIDQKIISHDCSKVVPIIR